MQSATTEGLVHQEEENARRYTIVGIYNSNENMCNGLEDIWAKKTPAQAFVTLSSPDVAVTNKSDKKEQLPKIWMIDDRVRGACSQPQQLEVHACP